MYKRRRGRDYDRRLSRSAAMRPRFGLTAPVASSRHVGHWIVPSALRSAATHVRQISCAPEHGRTIGAWRRPAAEFCRKHDRTRGRQTRLNCREGEREVARFLSARKSAPPPPRAARVKGQTHERMAATRLNVLRRDHKDERTIPAGTWSQNVRLSHPRAFWSPCPRGARRRAAPAGRGRIYH